MNQEQKLAALAAAQMHARKDASRPPATTGQRKPVALRCELDAEGDVALFGLRRTPIILSPNQWRQLLAFGPQIQQCIDHHAEHPDPVWEDG